jgi:hypothetical protein
VRRLDATSWFTVGLLVLLRRVVLGSRCRGSSGLPQEIGVVAIVDVVKPGGWDPSRLLCRGDGVFLSGVEGGVVVVVDERCKSVVGWLVAKEKLEAGA